MTGVRNTPQIGDIPASGTGVGHLYPIDEASAQNVVDDFASRPHTAVKAIISDSFQSIKSLISGLAGDESIQSEANDAASVQDQNGNQLPAFKAFQNYQDQSASQIADLAKQISGSDNPDISNVRAATSLIMGGLVLDEKGGLDRNDIKALSNLVGSELNYIKENTDIIDNTTPVPHKNGSGGFWISIPYQP